MTEMTRRTVLATSATGVAATLVGGLPVPNAAAAPTVLGVESARPASGFTRNAKLYRRERFKAQRKASFKVRGPGVKLRMKLVDVSNIPLVTKGSNRSFELTFRSKRPGPEQGTYTFRRPGFKATSLFVVPTDTSRRTYRATVNNR